MMQRRVITCLTAACLGACSLFAPKDNELVGNVGGGGGQSAGAASADSGAGSGGGGGLSDLAGAPSVAGQAGALGSAGHGANTSAPETITGVITRIKAYDGGQANHFPITRLSISDDGNLIAFSSAASNLTPELDDNNAPDIFVYDVAKNEVSRLSFIAPSLEPNNWSVSPAITGDGQEILFVSLATNLVHGVTSGAYELFGRRIGSNEFRHRNYPAHTAIEGPAVDSTGKLVVYATASDAEELADTNGVPDIYTWDGVTATRISLGLEGEEPNGTSLSAAVDSQGRYVAFESQASNLLRHEDTNAKQDVFLRELNGTVNLQRVSVSSDGEQGDGDSGECALSGDGQLVAFTSRATNLVTGDSNEVADVFVRELRTGRTLRVSVSSTGEQADGESGSPSLTKDGRVVVFQSLARNLITNETPVPLELSYRNVFAHDLETRKTFRISAPHAVAPGAGVPDESRADNNSSEPVISANGRVIAFVSAATNLVPGDTNQKVDVFVFRFTSAPWL